MDAVAVAREWTNHSKAHPSRNRNGAVCLAVCVQGMEKARTADVIVGLAKKAVTHDTVTELFAVCKQKYGIDPEEVA